MPLEALASMRKRMTSLLRKLSIGPRLAAAFAVLGLALVVVAGVGAEKLQSLKAESRHIDQRQVPALRLAGELATNQARTGSLLTRMLYVFADQPGRQAEVKQAIDATVARNQEIGARLARELAGTSAQDELKAYQALDAKVDTVRARIVAHPATARTSFARDIAPLAAKLDVTTAHLIRAVNQEVSATVEHQASDASAGTRLMILIGAIALALAALLAVLITLTVVRPVRAAADRLRRLDEQDLSSLSAGLEAAASGDLTVAAGATTEPLAVEGSDELTELTETLNSMLAKAHASIGAFETMRGQLSAVIGDVAAGSGTVAAASQQMASTSSETGRSVEEIAMAIGTVAHGSEQ
jgi:methyl-accepting chemotaxis protein